MNFRVLCLILLMTLVLGSVQLFGQQKADAASQSSPDQSSTVLPHWLQFSGELRSRLEGVTGGGFKPNADDLYMLTRVRLGMKIQPTPWLKFMVQGQDAHVFWKNQHPAAPPYQDTFDLRQGYVEIGDTEKMTFGFRAGRQELAYGDERLVGNSNWTNVARSFDGFRGTFRHDGVRLDVFAASVVKIIDLQFNKYVPGANIYGLYGGFEKLIPKSTVEPYFFWRRSSGVTTETGRPGILNFGTLGLRWVGKLPDGFDYATEMAKQMGSLGTDTVRAWAGHWVLGYTVPRARFTPRFFAEFNYATGDHNPTDGHRGTFDQLYATAHDKYGMADQVGWKNIEHLRGAVEFKLRANWQATVKHNAWWLADSHDALYNSSSNVVARVSSGAAGRYVGQEIDLQTSYTFPHKVQLGGGFGHIYPGTFLLHATPGISYNFPYAMVTYTF
jgi:hypothetical protein